MTFIHTHTHIGPCHSLDESKDADCAAVTFHGDVDPRGQEQASEAVVEDLVSLQRGRSVVRDFDA